MIQLLHRVFVIHNGHLDLHLLIQPWTVLRVPGIFLLVFETGYDGGVPRECRFAVEHRVGIWSEK